MKVIIEFIDKTSFFEDFILVLIGAIIGFFTSIGTIIVQKYIDRRGKINIFYRKTFIFGSNNICGGIDKDAPGFYSCTIPLYLEVQNISDSTRVIRDFCLVLYNKGKKVDKMWQLTNMHTTEKSGNEVIKEQNFEFGSEKNSYSFVIPPRSIQRQNCCFGYQYEINSENKIYFDEIKVRYFDEKNKEKIHTFQKIDNCRKNQKFPVDNEWILVE